MNAVLIVLPDGRRCPEVLRALRDAGAHSAAVQDQPGLDMVFWRGVRGAMARQWDQRSGAGKTVLAIVPDVLTQRVVAAAEQLLAGVGGPASGMVMAWALAHVGAFQGEVRAGQRVGGLA